MTPTPVKPRILIVEDEAIVARDISQQLAELGYEPLGPAARGEDAIILAGELLPDLVLMDIQLAGEINGIMAAAAIRNHFGLPVVFLTAFAADDMLAQAKLTEPFGYVLKPFSSRELRVVLEMALYKYQIEARLRDEARHNQAILDNMIDGVISLNEQAVIESCNQATINLFGYGLDQILDQGLALLIPAAASNGLCADLQLYQQMAALHISGYPTELLGQRQDGSHFPLHLSLSQVTRGVKTTFIAVVSDLSDRKNDIPDLAQKVNAEAQKKALRAPLLQQQQLLRELLESPLSSPQVQQLSHIASLGASVLTLID